MKLKRLARLVLICIGLLTVGSVFLLPQLRFDYEFESFFPVDDPDLEFYMDYRSRYEADNDFVLVSAQREAGIFDSLFLARVHDLSNRLGQLDYIQSVQDPTQLKQFVWGGLGPIEVPYLHIQSPQRFSSDSMRIYQSPSLVGSFFSKSGRAVSIVLQTDPGLSKVKSDSLASMIESVVSESELDCNIAGRISGQKYYVELMKQELVMFMSIAIVLVVIFLFVTFRSSWGVWVPLVVVLLSILWLLSVMTLNGKAIDLLLVLMPTILFVVGMSDVVHMLSRYLEELRNGHDKNTAVKIAFRHVGMATLLTSVTTAVGFLTLLTANVLPVKSFGVYTAIGVIIALILAFSLLPSVLLLSKTPKIADQPLEELFWSKRMHRLFAWVVRKRRAIVWSGTLILLVAIFGASMVKVDNYLLEDLPKNDPHREQFEYFEKEFSGVRPFEMEVSLRSTEATIFDEAVLIELNKVDSLAQRIYPLGFQFSLISLAKEVNQSLHGGDSKYYKLPQNARDWSRLKKILRRFERMGRLDVLVSEGGQAMRFSGKIEDVGGYRMKGLNSQFLEEIKRLDLNLDVRLTGMSFLIDKNNQTLSKNMILGLFIAFAVIAIIMGGFFKSFKMIVITLIPNIIPLVFIAGFMGFVGIDLKVSTSIIFTIAFGIAVDDTIHYMSKLRMELLKGRSLIYALKRTSISTGKAITITTLILFSGFISMIGSDFASTYYVGLLVGLTLLLAVVADLILLPALIMLFVKPEEVKASKLSLRKE